MCFDELYPPQLLYWTHTKGETCIMLSTLAIPIILRTTILSDTEEWVTCRSFYLKKKNKKKKWMKVVVLPIFISISDGSL